MHNDILCYVCGEHTQNDSRANATRPLLDAYRLMAASSAEYCNKRSIVNRPLSAGGATAPFEAIQTSNAPSDAMHAETGRRTLTSNAFAV